MKKIILFLFLGLHSFSAPVYSDTLGNIKTAVYKLDLQKPISYSSINHLVKPSSVQKYMNNLQIGKKEMHGDKTSETVLEENNIKRFWYTYFPELMHQGFQNIAPIQNLFLDKDTHFNLIIKLTDNLFALSDPENLFIYDYDKKTLQKISELQSQVHLMMPLNNGLQFATCSSDSVIQVWDTLNHQRITTFQAHNAFIEKIFDTGNSSIMSFCKGEQCAREWSFYGKNLNDYLFGSVEEFDQFASTVPDEILSDRYCSIATPENSVALYNSQLQEVVCEFEGAINSVKLLTNGLITSCTGQGIQLYNITTDACVQSLNFLFCNETNALVQTQCGNILFVLGGQLYLWEIYPAYLKELSLNQGALIIQLLGYKNDDIIFVHPDWYKVFEELPSKFKVTYLEEFMHKIEPLALSKRNENPGKSSPQPKKSHSEIEQLID